MATERLQRRIEQFLDEAEEAVARLDWGVVRDRARAVLGLDPSNKDGLALLAAAERELGQAPSPINSVSSTPSAPTAEQPTSFANGRYVVLPGRGRQEASLPGPGHPPGPGSGFRSHQDRGPGRSLPYAYYA